MRTKESDLDQSKSKSGSVRRMILAALATLLVFECLLLLAGWLEWIGVDGTKGWPVLIAVGAALLLPVVLLVGWAISAGFRTPFQIPLRAFGLLMLVVAIPCAWLSLEIHRSRQQELAVNAVLGAGGQVYYHDGKKQGPEIIRDLLGDDFFTQVDSVEAKVSPQSVPGSPFGAAFPAPPPEAFNRAGEFTNSTLEQITRGLAEVKGLNLSSAKIDDEGLVHLHEFHNLENLLLNETPITDAGMAPIAGLPTIRMITLRSTRVTDEGLAQLARLSELEHLHLSRTGVTDAGLRHLSGLTKLQSLGLEFTAITDEGLAHVAGLNNLTWLNLRKTNVTGAGMRHLVGMRSLTHLYLDSTQVDDGGLAELKDLPELKMLFLAETRVTDDGLRHLEIKPSLKTLILPGRNLSDAAVQRLSGGLPNCKIMLAP